MLLIFSGIVAVILYIEGMLLPSLLAISRDFGVTLSQTSLVLALYAVGGTALVPVIGKIGDIYGKKKVVTYLLAIYAISVTVTGFSPNFDFMLAARTIQGISLAIIPLLLSLVREEFPKEQVPKATGILNGMYGVGFAISIPLGAWVSNNYGWRATYHTAIPFVVIFAIVTILMIKESPFKRPRVKVDYIGAILLGAPLAMIALALGEGSSWGWTSVDTLALLTIGILTFIPLILYERMLSRKGGEPILDLRLLSIRNVMAANITTILAVVGMILAFQVFIYKFEYPSPVGYGLSIFSAGVSLLPLALALLIVSPIAGVLAPKTGVKPLGISGALIGALGFYLSAQAASYNELLMSMFIAGIGLAIGMTCTINLLVLSVDVKDMGLATSMNTALKNLGSSVGAPIGASLLSTFTISLAVGTEGGKTIFAKFPSSAAFQYSFYIAAIVFLLLAVTILFANEVLGHGKGADLKERMRAAKE